MTKQEIIEELATAQYVYAGAIEKLEMQTYSEAFHYLHKQRIFAGLCFYFDYTLPDPLEKYVEFELEKDLLHQVQPGEYWYTVFEACETVQEIIRKALEPRHAHLQRTIARLQEELQTSNAFGHE